MGFCTATHLWIAISSFIIVELVMGKYNAEVILDCNLLVLQNLPNFCYIHIHLWCAGPPGAVVILDVHLTVSKLHHYQMCCTILTTSTSSYRKIIRWACIVVTIGFQVPLCNTWVLCVNKPCPQIHHSSCSYLHTAVQILVPIVSFLLNAVGMSFVSTIH